MRPPGAHTQAARCLRLVRVFADGKWHSMASLAANEGVSERAIYRDIAAFRIAGWTVERDDRCVRVTSERGDR